MYHGRALRHCLGSSFGVILSRKYWKSIGNMLEPAFTEEKDQEYYTASITFFTRTDPRLKTASKINIFSEGRVNKRNQNLKVEVIVIEKVYGSCRETKYCYRFIRSGEVISQLTNVFVAWSRVYKPRLFSLPWHRQTVDAGGVSVMKEHYHHFFFFFYILQFVSLVLTNS